MNYHPQEPVESISSEPHRAELAEFLRTRRQRANPADFGFQIGARRRTPGLRREEVAQLSFVSLAWYTFLEQGRPVRASADVLDRLCRGLRLDRAEREHLYLLARGHPPNDVNENSWSVDPQLQQILDAISFPAYASLNDWTIVAANRVARLVFFDQSVDPDGPLNTLKLVFADPVHRRIIVNWEQQAKDTLALFRASTAQNIGEDWHRKLVEEVSEVNEEFRTWWPQHEIRASHGGPKEFDHPTVGRMTFEPKTLRYEGDIPVRIIIKIPSCEKTATKLDQLLSDQAADNRSAQSKISGT
ncbi:helix-turn-helix domain-containing protein [Luteolibacter pohnpeiensis]|uniref:Helix-turn-helix domain-containing protein n=1 Tax=Luteolibacter pohnpeiensis TaxID=454153 RepID=A0A934S6X7_9BACT|nr:helix-turn-helix transcriptional regulator [Luteolibacter pohnpeiensis]MBK1882314.1 helix-turn-helix domain-containing protein [Luteolibacter pohnpeiensis]